MSVQPWKFRLQIDPSKIGTAQQKKLDPRTRRFFTDRRVAKSMKAISLMAGCIRRAGGVDLPKPESPVRLSLVFFYAVPKSRRRTVRGEPPPEENSPCSAFWAGDCDNRAKAVIDAFTDAGFWPDDRYVTRLEISKRWTYQEPFIEAEIGADEGQ